MKFEEFLSHHWKIFLRHTCQFYPLTRDFLEQYEYELDWRALSKNKLIAWDLELLERFEDRFLWHELGWNDSIIWHINLIERFKKRLDWYYLGRNVNLPISEEFIAKYRKKIFIIEDNRYLTEKLRSQYGKDLLPAQNLPVKALSEEEFDNLAETLSDGRRMSNWGFRNLYEYYIQPHIIAQGIEQIFAERFGYSQRYYKIKAIHHDIHGLTPEFRTEGKSVFSDFREGRGFFEIEDEIHLVSGSLQEGPPRLYEVPRFSGLSFYPVLLISENVRNVLEQFNISPHKFIPVKLTPKRISTDLQYWILQLEYDSLLKQANFQNIQFQRVVQAKVVGSKEKTTLAEGEITAYEQLEQLAQEGRAAGIFATRFTPLAYPINTDDDIFTLQSDIVVNEFVKQAIEAALPKQVLFESAQLQRIRIPQDKYESKRNILHRDIPAIKDAASELAEDYKFFAAKAQRLEESEEAFVDRIEIDEFWQVQKDFNVIIPSAFKERYRDRALTSEEYYFLPISDFFLENAYADKYPKTYKSLIVAGNGCGDYLGLILEKDSDFRLGAGLIAFDHEIGEVDHYQSSQ
ncbi:MAG: hypothetical protein AAFN81_05285 [Bacteroidota bacterium]